jgi:hypothetical protein
MSKRSVLVARAVHARTAPGKGDWFMAEIVFQEHGVS